MKIRIVIGVLFCCILFCFSCEEESFYVYQRDYELPWPEWIFSHWVWEDEGTQESIIELVDGYLNRNIPVGAIVIDSPWEAGTGGDPTKGYNTFEWDNNLYPDPKGMVDYFHSKGIKVMIWITCVINTDAPNYQYAKDKGYFLKDGAVYQWWKGYGSWIDYKNPEAVEYWHSLMDRILDLGIDGWKVDGADFSLYEQDNEALWDEYKELYYRDFFDYTREKLGNDRVITARPIDATMLPSYRTVSPFAPQDINFCGWVGDQPTNWKGIRMALDNILLSAKMGYLGAGSDIGGYMTWAYIKEVFIRWGQFGAFCPIMEVANGGFGGTFTPWDFDEQTARIYRKFVNIHYDLIPYFDKQYEIAWNEGRSMILPPSGTWDDYNAEAEYGDPDYILDEVDYSYKLGPDIFVAIMYEPGTSRSITFPEGDNWVDWWDGTVYTGGTTIDYSCPLDKFPAFRREGASFPR